MRWSSRVSGQFCEIILAGSESKMTVFVSKIHFRLQNVKTYNKRLCVVFSKKGLFLSERLKKRVNLPLEMFQKGEL